MIDEMSERRLWFVRRDKQVKGPFLSAQITRNILLGRLRPTDEVSLDERNWNLISKYRELYPEVMQEMTGDVSKLEQARIQADERVQKQRRKKQKMANERRQAKERRGTESDKMLLHRKHREELNELGRNVNQKSRLPMFSIFLMMFILVGFAYVTKKDEQSMDSDCNAPVNKGINWSNCSFIELNIENMDLSFSTLADARINQSRLLGVNLQGSDMAYIELINSDLSYANLEGVRLTGANLKQTDLRYANLKDADLSYVDLSGAQLAGANLENTILNNAIWTDARVCKRGSVGKCLF